MSNTTSDYIDLDLDGTITAAIKKLAKLKGQYPKGVIDLTSHYEYGESYPRLRLNFTRPKDKMELELESTKASLGKLRALYAARKAFTDEGQEYPRENEIAKLEETLGVFAKNPNGWLQIYGEQIVMYDPMLGAYTREGDWAYVMLMSGYGDDAMWKEWCARLGVKPPKLAKKAKAK